MKKDISALLREWPHEPGQVTARIIPGADGLPRVQVRLDLGLLQMHADGRPDGERPFGYDSVLEYFEAKLDEAASPEPGAGAEEPSEPQGALLGEEDETATARSFRLSSEDCRALREEAAQFYQRYVACLALEEFERVVRDTSRNLRVLDLCGKHASGENDRTVLEQYRPYIVMVRARALASQAIKENELRAAVLALDQALDLLKRYYEEQAKAEQFDGAEEVRMLRSMRDALMPRLPISQKAELRQRLQRALEQENYELAAILRDELKHVRD